ncbi:hypothetical protein [Aeromonas hydrophila]|uniref:hypothetical protein n=1 Tax=Aeromonas hydrophila TaxID=644 RepID=UPI003D1A36DD
MNHGHWTTQATITPTTKAFVYVVTMDSGEKYVGYKTVDDKGKWLTYKTSSKVVKGMLSKGHKAHFHILETFDSKDDAWFREGRILRDVGIEDLLNQTETMSKGLSFSDDEIEAAQKIMRAVEEERITKIVEAIIIPLVDTNSPKFKGYYVIDGVRYATVEEAAKTNRMSVDAVRYRTKTEKYSNFMFEPVAHNEPVIPKEAKTKKYYYEQCLAKNGSLTTKQQAAYNALINQYWS